MVEQLQRGVSFHEAGHAILLWWFDITVSAVYVAFSEAKGWHGGTDIVPGSDDHLPFLDKVMICAGGRAAEDVFNCPAHDHAWLDDRWKIGEILNANAVPEGQHKARITEAKKRARPILEANWDGAFRLTDRLVECGRVEAAEFLKLMAGA